MARKADPLHLFLFDAEQGAGTASASHPNLLQRHCQKAASSDGGWSSGASNEKKANAVAREVLEYKFSFWTQARIAMIDQVTELRKQVRELEKCRPPRDVPLTESEDETTDPEFDRATPAEMPANSTDDLQQDEILKYEEGQLFSL